MGTQHAVYILRLLAYMAGLWLWGLSVWFFLVSVGSLWKYLRPENKAKLRFQMTWFSFVFPNTALVSWLVCFLSLHRECGRAGAVMIWLLLTTTTTTMMMRR